MTLETDSSLLDIDNPLPPLQSATIISALKAMAPQIAIIITQLTGKVFDVDTINNLVTSGASMVLNLVSIYYCVKVIRNRINATQVIQKGKVS